MQTSFQFGGHEMENKRRQHPGLWEKHYKYLRDEMQITTNVVLAGRMIGFVEYKVWLAGICGITPKVLAIVGDERRGQLEGAEIFDARKGYS